MTVGIVGGNGKVGIELAHLLRQSGYTVIPVVRNRKGAAFLGCCGFDCRIADPTVPEELRRVLTDVDVVIIAAHAGIGARDMLDFKSVWRTNKAIVRNSVTCSQSEAAVIYFSSIAAFGNRLYNSWTRGRFDHYSLNKRWLERLTRKLARRESKDAYVFRLGHVFGPSQPKTDRFRRISPEGGALEVAVDADRASNVVHTVTIGDAIGSVLRGKVNPGTHTIVNQPQWTWAEIIDHYVESSTKIRFIGRPTNEGRGYFQMFVGRLAETVSNHRMKLLPLQVFLPDAFNLRVVYQFKRRQAIDGLEREREGTTEPFHTHEFDYRPVPGPFPADLSPTRSLLEREEVVRAAFDGAFDG